MKYSWPGLEPRTVGATPLLAHDTVCTSGRDVPAWAKKVAEWVVSPCLGLLHVWEWSSVSVCTAGVAGILCRIRVDTPCEKIKARVRSDLLWYNLSRGKSGQSAWHILDWVRERNWQSSDIRNGSPSLVYTTYHIWFPNGNEVRCWIWNHFKIPVQATKWSIDCFTFVNKGVVWFCSSSNSLFHRSVNCVSHKRYSRFRLQHCIYRISINQSIIQFIVILLHTIMSIANSTYPIMTRYPHNTGLPFKHHTACCRNILIWGQVN